MESHKLKVKTSQRETRQYGVKPRGTPSIEAEAIIQENYTSRSSGISRSRAGSERSGRNRARWSPSLTSEWTNANYSDLGLEKVLRPIGTGARMGLAPEKRYSFKERNRATQRSTHLENRFSA
jgi:hypothetical protein